MANWHVTLSAFLRDYLYVPLGGNRRGPARRYANLLVTMVLGGLWHGAAWTFVLWGAGLAVAHLWRGQGGRLPATVSRPLTLLFVPLAWVPFRAATISDAVAMARHAGATARGAERSVRRSPQPSSPSAPSSRLAPNSQEIMGYGGARSRWPAWSPSLGWAVASAGAFGIALARLVDAPTYFLYFRF